jgi:copper chaperone CopZ
MFRRNFITQVALSAAAIGKMTAADTKTVTYKIKGFTCVTCAVGLDTLMQQQEGVVRSKSTYPEAVTTIEFKPSVITEKSLKGFISEMGFQVL